MINPLESSRGFTCQMTVIIIGKQKIYETNAEW